MTPPDRRAGIRQRQKLRNLAQGALLLATLVALAVALAWWVFGPEALPWVVGTGLLVGLLRPRVPVRWTLWSRGAVPVPLVLAPEVHHIVRVLSERAELARVPSIYYVPTGEPNAFAVGEDRQPVLGVTDGLLRLLGTRELVGVLAHEISHLRNGDTRIMMLSDVLGRFVQLLAFIGLWSMAVTIPLATREPSLLLGSALLLVMPTVVTLLQLALSRSRELDADLDGATLTGDPEGLARGLLLLESSGSRRRHRGTATRGRALHPALLSHPPTAVRVERLRRLAQDQGPATPADQPSGG